ncbi:hypothetical protein FRC07_001402 [Ceratobasidium sp. 392]|nr:hypothetical protein FRC07_001402 [Ceratobasidium sp. 392]
MPPKRKSPTAAEGSSSVKKRRTSVSASTPAPDKPYPAHLPDKKLTFEHKEWLVRHQAKYNKALGPKGGTDGGSKYVREFVLDDFVAEYFPGLAGEVLEEFLPHIYKTVNTRLNNESKKKGVHCPVTKDAPVGPVNAWFHDNQDAITEEFNDICKAEGKEFDVTALRSYYCAKYRKTHEGVQLAYTQRHVDEKALLKAKVVPEAQRPMFATQLTRKIAVMVREAEEKAAVWFEGTLGYVSGGVLELKRISTPLATQYLMSDEGQQASQLAEGWLSRHLQVKTPTDDIPQRFPAPCREEYMRPLIPDTSVDQPDSKLARSWTGTVWSAVWQLYGGNGHIPYKEIIEDIEAGHYSWIPKECIPANTVFKEPGKLKKAECLVWLDHLRDWRIDSSSFRFAKVYTVKRSLFPSNSQASSLKELDRNGVGVYLATYNGPVTAPQNAKAVTYPQEGWDYMYYSLKAGESSSDATKLPRGALPTCVEGDAGPITPFCSEEVGMVEKIFQACEPRPRKIVSGLMDAFNRLEQVLPHWAAKGLWAPADASSQLLPRLLPAAHPTQFTGPSFWKTQWLEPEYYQRPKAGSEHCSRDFLENYQFDSRTGVPGFHAETGTLVGGHNGSAWIARGIIKYCANAGAVHPSTSVKFNVPIPAGYDSRRLSVKDFERSLDWAEAWTGVVEQSIAILAPSAAERWQPPGVDVPTASGRIRLESITLDLTSAAGGSRKKRIASEGESDLGEDEEQGLGTAFNVQSEDELEPNPNKKGKGKATAAPKSSRPKPIKPSRRTLPCTKTTKSATTASGSPSTAAQPPVAGPAQDESDSASASEPEFDTTPYLKHWQKLEDKVASRAREEIKYFKQDKAAVFAEFKKNPPPYDQDPERAEQQKATYNKLLSQWVDKQSVFNTVPELSTAKPCDLAPEQVLDSVHAFDSRVSELLEEWREDEREWDSSYDYAVIEFAGTLVYHKRPTYAELEFAIALHGCLFNWSSRWASRVTKRIEEIHSALAEGSPLLRHLDNLENTGQLPELPIGTIVHLRGRVFTLRQMYTQITELTDLSLKWRNISKDRFWYNSIPYSLNKLVLVGGMLQQWTKETSKLRARLDRNHLKEWVNAKLCGSRRPDPCYFNFGNPIVPFAFSNSARAELNAARDALAQHGSSNAVSDIPTCNPRPRKRPSVKKVVTTADDPSDFFANDPDTTTLAAPPNRPTEPVTANTTGTSGVDGGPVTSNTDETSQPRVNVPNIEQVGQPTSTPNQPGGTNAETEPSGQSAEDEPSRPDQNVEGPTTGHRQPNEPDQGTGQQEESAGGGVAAEAGGGATPNADNEPEPNAAEPEQGTAQSGQGAQGGDAQEGSGDQAGASMGESGGAGGQGDSSGAGTTTTATDATTDAPGSSGPKSSKGKASRRASEPAKAAAQTKKSARLSSAASVAKAQEPAPTKKSTRLSSAAQAANNAPKTRSLRDRTSIGRPTRGN